MIFAPGTLYYVPITITNAQSTATPSPFQAMVIVNSSTYASYLASDLSNVNFQDGNGNILYSWLESGNSNSSTTSVYWIKLPNGIGANSSVTIYYCLYSTSTNNFNNTNTGEAPQLSPTYAQYDNGANVFSNYWNFAGTSLPSGWDTQGVWNGSVNNGLNISATGKFGGVYTSISPVSNVIAESYIKVISIQAFALELSQTNTSGNDGYTFNDGYIGGFVLWDSYAQQIERTSNPLSRLISSNAFSFTAGSSYVVSLAVANGSITESINYGNNLSASDSSYSSFSYLMVGEWADGTNFIAYWIRTRAYPPSNTMPSVSFGSLSSPPSSSFFMLLDGNIS